MVEVMAILRMSHCSQPPLVRALPPLQQQPPPPPPHLHPWDGRWLMREKRRDSRIKRIKSRDWSTSTPSIHIWRTRGEPSYPLIWCWMRNRSRSGFRIVEWRTRNWSNASRDPSHWGPQWPHPLNDWSIRRPCPFNPHFSLILLFSNALSLFSSQGYCSHKHPIRFFLFFLNQLPKKTSLTGTLLFCITNFFVFVTHFFFLFFVFFGCFWRMEKSEVSWSEKCRKSNFREIRKKNYFFEKHIYLENGRCYKKVINYKLA